MCDLAKMTDHVRSWTSSGAPPGLQVQTFLAQLEVKPLTFPSDEGNNEHEGQLSQIFLAHLKVPKHIE